jgi:hypothetical protein
MRPSTQRTSRTSDKGITSMQQEHVDVYIWLRTHGVYL